MMDNEKITPSNVAAWKEWLEKNHSSKNEIWVRTTKDTYLFFVEEAICYGWIDGIAKKFENDVYQRFTPRSIKSHWTELNKARARKLIQGKRMQPAGREVLPDLSSEYIPPNHILLELKEDQEVWKNYQKFPKLYKNVRLSYIDEFKVGSTEYQKRLRNFIEKTRKNILFGNWNDNGRLIAS